MKRREERYCEVLFGVPVSATTALNTSEPKVALMRCDVPVTCGSLDRVVNIGVLWQGWLRMLSIVTKGGLITSSLKLETNPTRFWVAGFSQKGTRYASYNLNGKGRPMRYEKSEELIVAITVEPVKQRTCIDGCRGRLCRRKT